MMAWEYLSPFASRAASLRGLAAATGVLLAGAAMGINDPAPKNAVVPNASKPSPTQAPASAMAELSKIAADSAPLAQGSDAKLRNLALPLTPHGIEAAIPFRTPSGEPGSGYASARQCLALAMYYEAGFEGSAGRMAVGQVVLNRVRHPAFPHRVCDVVFQQSGTVCQFTFACDGAMRKAAVASLWKQTLAEADSLLAGKVYSGVGMATHYHANYVLPAWAPKLDKIAVIGAHVFYRWPDGWGRRSQFTSSYDGLESVPSSIVAPPLKALDVPGDATSLAASMEVSPRKSPNEGGFVDTTKGWKPKISNMD